MNIEKVLYDRRGAAAALSICVRSLDYLISAKRIRTRRIGKKVMVPASELKRFAQRDHIGPIRCRSQREGNSPDPERSEQQNEEVTE